MEEINTSQAFAPAAISNFFRIHDSGLYKSGYTDFSKVGATGGGFVLSRGVYTRATAFNGSNARRIRIRVNGSAHYRATTTRRALELLVSGISAKFSDLEIEQQVEVPIGYGFGTSAASALSAVLAASSTLGLGLAKERVAYFAHAADIICQTGLGTVSSVWNYSGAGVITKAGAPGVATVANVPVPEDVVIVVALLAPFRKSRVLSSRVMRERLNRFGALALSEAKNDLTLERLVRSGEMFSRNLGLETEEIRRLIELSLNHGAIGASQNMIGHSIHAIVNKKNLNELVTSLISSQHSPLVLVLGIGKRPAALIEAGSSNLPKGYQVTSPA